MFDVVADVERYPQFLPWCVGLRVRSRTKEGAREVVLAEMLVGYKALRERYTSRIVLDRSHWTIDVTQTEGVFRRLDNHWRFAPRAKGCEVAFAIEFEFKSRLLGAVANAALGGVLLKMSHAFEARAEALSREALSKQTL